MQQLIFLSGFTEAHWQVGAYADPSASFMSSQLGGPAGNLNNLQGGASWNLKNVLQLNICAQLQTFEFGGRCCQTLDEPSFKFVTTAQPIVDPQKSCKPIPRTIVQ